MNTSLAADTEFPVHLRLEVGPGGSLIKHVAFKPGLKVSLESMSVLLLGRDGSSQGLEVRLTPGRESDTIFSQSVKGGQWVTGLPFKGKDFPEGLNLYFYLDNWNGAGNYAAVVIFGKYF